MAVTAKARLAALKDAVVDLGEAWAVGDTATLDQLLSPTYTHHAVYGARRDRAASLASVAKRAGRGTIIELRDVEYRVFGDVAIVTGTTDLRGGGARFEDDPRDLVFSFTQVWVWRDGRWFREAFQGTPVIDDVVP
jgi:ketosteroid isomerase-like protein